MNDERDIGCHYVGWEEKFDQFFIAQTSHQKSVRKKGVSETRRKKEKKEEN